MENWNKLNERIIKEITSNFGNIQPGYLGKNYKTYCVAFIAIRPGSPKAWSAEDQARMERLKFGVGVAEFQQLYGEMLKAHPLITRFVNPTLELNNLTWDNVMWVNIVKSPSLSNEPVTQKEIEQHLPYLVEQLAIARPNITVSLGAQANAVVSQIKSVNHLKASHYSFLVRQGNLDLYAKYIAKEVKNIIDNTPKSLKEFIIDGQKGM